jgi:hypothetical protein
MAKFNRSAILSLIDAELEIVKATELAIEKQNREAKSKAVEAYQKFLSDIDSKINEYVSEQEPIVSNPKPWWKFWAENFKIVKPQTATDIRTAIFSGNYTSNIIAFLGWYERKYGVIPRRSYSKTSLANYCWRIEDHDHVVPPQMFLLMLKAYIGCRAEMELDDNELSLGHQVNLICAIHANIRHTDESIYA